MPENNFEQQVQLKMDELQFTPSEKVWQQLEPRIREKRKRRRWMLIPLFITAMLGSLALYDNIRPHQGRGYAISGDGSRAVESNTNNVAVIAEENKVYQNNQKEIPAKESLNIESADDNIALNEGPAFRSTQPKKTTERVSVKRSKHVSKKTRSLNEKEIVSDEKNDIAAGDPQLTVADELQNISLSRADSAQQKDVAVAPVKKDTVAETKDIADLKKNEKKKKQNLWHIGFTASAGASSVGKGFLRSSTSEPLASNGGSPGMPQQISSNETGAGFSFAAGVYAERKIAKKLSADIGLKYALYSYTLRTGERVNVSGQYNNMGDLIPASYYYASGASRKLRNDLHFLQLSTAVKWQLNRSASMPIYWRGGINVQHLIGSNAVLFIPADTVYIHNNSLLNKTQWGLETGIELGLFNKSRMPMTIGPEFRYHFTEFSRVSSGPRNFSYVGIRLGLRLTKK